MQISQLRVPGTPVATTTLAAEALFVAQTQIDVREIGNNGGAAVDRYLRSVGLGTGFPWCMAFVYWCVQMAATRLGTTNPLVRTAGVLRMWNETTLPKIPGRSTAGIAPGDIFIMNFGGGKGHTGFVTRIANGIVHTIEGNTNDEGSREGYEVAERQRAISTITGYIKLN
jgi:hypothetical protein